MSCNARVLCCDEVYFFPIPGWDASLSQGYTNITVVGTHFPGGGGGGRRFLCEKVEDTHWKVPRDLIMHLVEEEGQFLLNFCRYC